MTVPISGGTPVSGGTATATNLYGFLERLRRKLDDELEPYLWSNDFLTDATNETIRRVCLELKLIPDETTSSVATYAVTNATTTITLHPSVTYVVKARLEAETTNLTLATAQDMDAAFTPIWRDAERSTPTYLVTDGMGDRTMRLYPPPDASDTLVLTVRRLPTTDLDWDTDQMTDLPIPSRFHSLLNNGVLAEAYRKQDVDTYNPKKSGDHEVLFMRDIELMKRTLLRADHHGWVYTADGMF